MSEMRNEAHLASDEILDLLHECAPAAVRRDWLLHIAGCVPCEENFRNSLIDRERSRSSFCLRRDEAGSLALHRRADVDHTSAIATVQRWLVGIRHFPRPLWATTCIGVAAILFLLVLRPSNEISWRDELGTLPSSSEEIQIRSAGLERDTKLSRGLEFYRSGEYENAIQELEHSTSSGSWETVRILFLASSYAKQDDAVTTIRLLESVDLATVPDPWAVESIWTLQSALREVGRGRDADILLRNLSERGDSWGQRAKRRQRTLSDER